MKFILKYFFNNFPNISSIISIFYLLILLKNNKLNSNEIEYNVLKKIVRKNSNVIDVGANIGRYTFMLQRIISRNNRCYSFEPNKRIFFILNSLIYLSGINNILSKNIAISNKKSEVNFKNIYSVCKFGDNKRNWYFDFNTESKIVKSNKFTKINCNKIDNFSINNVSFIKIDTEGHDYSVLLGSIKLIKKSLPNILIEENSMRVKRFFKKINYKKITYENLKRNHLYCSYKIFNKLKINLKNKTT